MPAAKIAHVECIDSTPAIRLMDHACVNVVEMTGARFDPVIRTRRLTLPKLDHGSDGAVEQRIAAAGTPTNFTILPRIGHKTTTSLTSTQTRSRSWTICSGLRRAIPGATARCDSGDSGRRATPQSCRRPYCVHLVRRDHRYTEWRCTKHSRCVVQLHKPTSTSRKAVLKE